MRTVVALVNDVSDACEGAAGDAGTPTNWQIEIVVEEAFVPRSGWDQAYVEHKHMKSTYMSTREWKCNRNTKDILYYQLK